MRRQDGVPCKSSPVIYHYTSDRHVHAIARCLLSGQGANDNAQDKRSLEWRISVSFSHKRTGGHVYADYFCGATFVPGIPEMHCS